VAQHQFNTILPFFSIAQKYLANRARKDHSASWPPKLNALSKSENTRKWCNEFQSMKLFGFVVERVVVWGYMVEVACNDWEFMDWEKGEKSKREV
jgi:hypothetical protein